MTTILQFINDAGIVGWFIMFTGFASIGLIFDRIKTLYFKYALNSDEFMKKIQSLVLAKKTEEALILCHQLESKPLASAFKNILEKADRDDESIFHAQDIAMAENAPLFTKRIHYLSMMANVATLLGLLGTIHGLILSFAAVAQADPSQKQAMLAHGISVSMYTTALGLVVAIPAMVAYSILVSKQNQLQEELTELTNKLTELLTKSHLPAFTQENIFKAPPPPPSSITTTSSKAS